MGCSGKTTFIVVLGIGIFLLLVGIVLIIFWPMIYNYILTDQLTLHGSSKGFEMWRETPIPMYLDVYFFNLTNAKELEKDWRIKPELQELGPYVFSEKHKRVNMTWNSNDTVTFQQIRTWHFQSQLSQGSLSDEITNINAIAATVSYVLRHKHWVIRRAVDLLMREKREKIFITRTAGELIFDGYQDKLLDLLHNLNVTGINVPFKKFGWFVERNESQTYDGIFNMHTGTDDFQNLGMIDRWNGYAQVPYYPGQCGVVHGTSGELWPPVKDNKTVYMFSSDICSVLTLDADGDTEVLGLEGSHFIGTKRVFDNGGHYKEMSCFNVGEQTPTGVRNVSECKFGAPAFLSSPHFYQADPSFLDRVVGLKPNKTLHEIYLDVEPNTGIPMNVRARAQLNILIQPIKGFKMYEKTVKTFMPVFWFVQRASLTEDYASQVKLLLTLPTLGLYTGIGIGCIGILVLFIIIVYNYHSKTKGIERQNLLASSQSLNK